VARSSFPPLLEIRSGEGRAFWLSFAALALIIGAHTLVETARDTLFLSRLPPERLAYVYVAVAIGTLLATPFSRWLVKWVGARNALIFTLLGSAFGIGWFRLRPHSTVGVFGLYVFGGLAITLLVAQFWIVASMLFTSAQGRRLFGPLSAGGVLGAVVGALLSTVTLLRHGVDTLLVYASLGFVLAALVATFFDIEEEGTLDPLAPAPLPNAVQEARREPLIWKIALIVALSTALSVVVDYVFKASAVAAYPSAELGNFFARYYLALNAVTLVLQVFLTGPLVARLGVLGVTLFSPSLLVLGALMATLTGVPLITSIALRGFDGGLRNSVQRVALELLWAPIERRQKPEAKSLVDGVVARGAQAAAAVGLGVLTTSAKAGLPTLTFICALLAGMWLAASLRVQRPYLELFRKALGRGDLDRDGQTRELDLTAVQALLEALARPDADDVIAAMNLLAERGRVRLIPALILYHDDERVLQRALELFADGERRDWFALGERLLQHRSQEVRLAAVRALALADARPALERAAQHDDVEVQARAALHLAQLSGHALRADPRVQRALEAEGDSGIALKLALIEAMGAHPSPEATSLLLELASDPRLTSAVTAALVNSADPNAIDFLIERLGTRKDRAAAQKGLVHIGAPAQSAIEARLHDVHEDRRVLLHLPLTLAKFENQAAVQVLLGVLRSEQHVGFVRYKALRGLQEIAQRTKLPIDPGPIHAEIARNATEYLRLLAMALPLRAEPATRERTSLSLVLGLVEDKLAQAIDRLERLVQIAQRTDDVPGVFRALASADRHERARAAEYLDALARGWDRRRDGRRLGLLPGLILDTASAKPSKRPLPGRLALLLGLVFGEASDEQRVQASIPYVGAPPSSSQQALTRLLDLGDPLLGAFARHARLSLPSLVPEPARILPSGVLEPGVT
jgi:AAA family ATP:ADP antiporter